MTNINKESNIFHKVFKRIKYTIKYIKKFSWKLKMRDNNYCPYCKDRLIKESYYVNDEIIYNHICINNECNFGKD